MDHTHDGKRVCGVPSRIGGSICRFDKTNWDGESWQGKPTRCRITWAPGNMPAATLNAVRWAWARWAAVCAIEPVEVANGQPALVVFEYGPIDGGSSTLAWAHLSCGADPVWPRHYQTRYDSAERWHLDPNHPPQNGIHLGAVACHEIGHLLGLDHDSRPGSRSLLAPTYRGDILTPQQWDVAQVQRRYGPPIADGAPSEPPEIDVPVKIVLDGKLWEGRVALVQ